MQERNGLTTRQLLERMDRRDARMDRRMDQFETTIKELALLNKQVIRILDRQHDRLNRLESRG